MAIDEHLHEFEGEPRGGREDGGFAEPAGPTGEHRSAPCDVHRSGVLLVRAWLHDGQVVARLQSSRSGEDEQRSAVAVGADRITESVREWLEDFSETQR